MLKPAKIVGKCGQLIKIWSKASCVCEKLCPRNGHFSKTVTLILDLE